MGNLFSSVKGKLTVVFLVIGLIPVLVLGHLGVTKIRQMLKTNVIEATTKEVSQVDKAINLYFETIKENCKLLATMPVVKKADQTITSYMNKSTKEELTMTPVENGGIEAEIYDLYANFAKAHPNAAYVYMATEDGGYIQEPTSTLMKNYDPRKRPFYKPAMENKGEVLRLAPYYFAADDAVIVSTLTTIEDNSGEVIGVQGLDVSLKGLTKMVKDINVGKTGYVILTTDDGTILANPKNPELNFKKIKKLGVSKLNNIAKIKNSNFEATMDKKDYLMNVYTSPKTGWKFITVIEREELSEKLNSIYRLIAIVLLISLIIIVIIAITFANKFSEPLIKAADFAQNIAEGRLNITPLEIKSKDEVANLAKMLNQMKNNLNNMIEDILMTAEDLSAYSEELSAASEQGSATIETNNKGLVEMTSGIEEISTSCEEVSILAEETSSQSQIGAKNIEKTVGSIENVNREVEKAVEIIEHLDDDSKKIDQIIEMINSIAEQTNLLALNAAIEAARAGEAGQGFAVVAEEIRGLSEETTKATDKIANLIKKIQNKSGDGLEAVQQVELKAKEGKDIVEETGEVFANIESSIEDTFTYIKETSVSAQELSSNSGQLQDATDDIRGISEEIANSSQDLTFRAQKLHDLVEKFEI